MSYRNILPQVFPYVVTTSPGYIRDLVRELFSPARADVPNGSSFAVTVDGDKGEWSLWLSEASYNYLNRNYHGSRWDRKMLQVNT